MTENLRVVRLDVEDYKRVKAVSIEPQGDVVVLSGDNGEGKSTVLDALFDALVGLSEAEPVRRGAEESKVLVSLGNAEGLHLVVSRRHKEDGKQYLEVRDADGVRLSPPRQLLDGLLGAVGFDPMEFAFPPGAKTPAAQGKAQRNLLLSLLDLPVDLDVLEMERSGIFNERTQVNRALKEAEAARNAVKRPESVGDIRPTAELIARQRAAEDALRAYHARREDLAGVERLIEETEGRIEDLRQKLEGLRRDRLDIETALSGQAEPVVPDLAAELAEIEAHNQAVREAEDAAGRWDEADTKVKKLEGRVADLTARIAEVDRKKDEALRAAEMPVPGLEVTEEGVTYRGVPFSQASTAERIRVSIAVGMRANPRLRVLVVRDGNCLDQESLALVREMVAEGGYQLWVERVVADQPGCIVIEDGGVKAPCSPKDQDEGVKAPEGVTG